MNASMTKVFEWLSGWRESSSFEKDQEGYITTERVGDYKASMFLWRVDKEPVRLDHTFLSDKIFVRFSDKHK